jgi:hypothetical protein
MSMFWTSDAGSGRPPVRPHAWPVQAVRSALTSRRPPSSGPDRLDPAAAARALGRLREMLAAHVSDSGVWFDSRAWIVTARTATRQPHGHGQSRIGQLL